MLVMKRRSLAAASLAALLLTACGGGVYLDVGDGYNGPPPTISLTASTGTARRGDLIRLSAAISAPNGISRVTFYRIDPGVSTLLATLSGPPAQVDTPIPVNAGNSVGYWARICDDAGYCAESATVTVGVVN